MQTTISDGTQDSAPLSSATPSAIQITKSAKEDDTSASALPSEGMVLDPPDEIPAVDGPASSSAAIPEAAPLQTQTGAPAVTPQQAQPEAEAVNLDGHQVKVFGASAPASSSSTAQPDDAFFEQSLSDVQSYHATVVARSKRLNDAPLLTSKYRDEEREKREKTKAEKWPTTTIRIKFSDATQIESTFPSTSPIQPVYAFVRSALDASSSSKPFILYQPPRTQYPEYPPPSQIKKPTTKSYGPKIVTPTSYGIVRGGPNGGLGGGSGGKESLNELGLVPQSVLMVRWEEEGMNATGYPAPLKSELIEKIVPLPAAIPIDPSSTSGMAGKKPATISTASGEKKIPKWLQKGLLKRK